MVDRILDTLCAYWRTDALTAAIDLGIFTALGRRARTAADLARDCAADSQRLRRLCDALVFLGFLRVKHGRYRSTADAARFLDARSPHTLIGVAGFLNAPPVTTAFATLADSIRRGPSENGAASRSRLWRDFAGATASLRRHLAVEMADELRSRGLGRGRILDVGAGGSPLGTELLRRRTTATLVVLDRSAVVKVAMRQAAAAGVAERVSALAGDAAALSWGGPYDLVLMVNVLDYFEARERARLVRKARAALAPGGVLAVCAPLLNERRTSPPEAVAYDLLLLALEAEGRPSTGVQLRKLLRGAGFSSVTRSGRLPLVLARRPR